MRILLLLSLLLAGCATPGYVIYADESAHKREAVMDVEKAMMMSSDAKKGRDKLDAEYNLAKDSLENKTLDLMAKKKPTKAEIEAMHTQAKIDQAQIDVMDRMLTKQIAAKFDRVLRVYAKEHGYSRVFEVEPGNHLSGLPDITMDVLAAYEKDPTPAFNGD